MGNISYHWYEKKPGKPELLLDKDLKYACVDKTIMINLLCAYLHKR